RISTRGSRVDRCPRRFPNSRERCGSGFSPTGCRMRCGSGFSPTGCRMRCGSGFSPAGCPMRCGSGFSPTGLVPGRDNRVVLNADPQHMAQTGGLNADPQGAEMKKLRVGVIGAGLIGRRHIATLLASRDAELCAVADTLPRDDPAIATLPVPVFSSHLDLLGRAKPDAVIVATPNRLHVPIGGDCARPGRPLTVETPH